MPIQSQRAMPSIAKEDRPEVNQTLFELYLLEERSAVSAIWLVSPFLFIGFYSAFSLAKYRHGCSEVSVTTSSGKAHEKHSSISEYLLVRFENNHDAGSPCNRCPTVFSDSELNF